MLLFYQLHLVHYASTFFILIYLMEKTHDQHLLIIFNMMKILIFDKENAINSMALPIFKMMGKII